MVPVESPILVDPCYSCGHRRSKPRERACGESGASRADRGACYPLLAILAGSDVHEDPGNALLRELELLVKAGLSPREALRAATTTPAQLLRRPDLANLAPGSPASFIVLNDNPLIDIANVRKLSTAMLHGRILSTEELARLRALPALRK